MQKGNALRSDLNRVRRRFLSEGKGKVTPCRRGRRQKRCRNQQWKLSLAGGMWRLRVLEALPLFELLMLLFHCFVEEEQEEEEEEEEEEV